MTKDVIAIDGDGVIFNLKEAQSKNTQIIYVPTEAGLPILETNRLSIKSK